MVKLLPIYFTKTNLLIEAIEVLKKGVKLNPKNAELLYKLICLSF